MTQDGDKQTDHKHDQKPDEKPEAIEPERVWEMIDRIDIAMLVTRSDQGMRGRPMSTIPKPERGLVYVLTESTSHAARDVRENGSIFLSFQGRGDHVALHGQAKVESDKTLVRELWSPGAEVFWPEGPEAHDVVALVIDPDHADVWDGHGLLRGIANIVRGAVEGRSPDLGTRGQADL